MSADKADMLEVELVYALPDAAFSRTLSVAAGSTIMDVVKRSGVLERYPEINTADGGFGIFGETLPGDAPVYDGARVEVYRSLERSPTEARRARARGGARGES